MLHGKCTKKLMWAGPEKLKYYKSRPYTSFWTKSERIFFLSEKADLNLEQDFDFLN